MKTWIRKIMAEFDSTPEGYAMDLRGLTAHGADKAIRILGRATL